MRDWENQARKNKVRWFLADTLPFWCWKTFIKPFAKAKSWLRYRTVDRYHTIKATLKPGYSMIMPCGWSTIDDVDFISRFQYSIDPPDIGGILSTNTHFLKKS